jgi:hypothetical protein
VLCSSGLVSFFQLDVSLSLSLLLMSEIFRIQKNIIRIMMGQTRRDSCRNLFKEMEILPLVSQYRFSLMLLVIKNRKEFTDNTEIYEIKTRQQKNLHQPLANLKKYQKGIH